jgi:hypothetical protein
MTIISLFISVHVPPNLVLFDMSFILQLTPSNAIRRVRLDIRTVRGQFWIQHKELLNGNAVAMGQYLARAAADVFVRVGIVATINVARLDRSLSRDARGKARERSLGNGSSRAKVALCLPCYGFAFAGGGSKR